MNVALKNKDYKMNIVRDGNAYCVRADNFVNLQESTDYFFIDEDEYQKYKNDIFELAYGKGDPNADFVKQALDRLLAGWNRNK